MGSSAGARRNPEWYWRKWYQQYLETGVPPTDLWRAVEHVVNGYRGLYSDSVYHLDDEDQFLRVRDSVIRAITASDGFKCHYHQGWDDGQLYGYVEQIVQREIRRARQEQYPAWFWMLRRLRKYGRTGLRLVDETRFLYVHPRCSGDGDGWMELDAITLEERLSAVPPLSLTKHQRIRGSDIQEAVERLFSIAEDIAIPLSTLVSHALRLVGINDPRSCPPSAWTKGDTEGSWIQADGADPLVEVEIRYWLERVLAPLSAEHLLVLKCHACDGMSFKKTSEYVSRALRIERFGAETARNRFHEAAALLSSGPSAKYKRGFVPNDDVEVRAFCLVLRPVLMSCLKTMNIRIEDLKDA